MVRHLDGVLIGAGLVHTGADVLKQILVVARAELRDDVLCGQCLDGFVLGDNRTLGQHDVLWAFLAVVDHVHGVIVVGLEQSHNKQVVGQQHDLLGRRVAVGILDTLVHVDAACAAVAETTGSRWALDRRGCVLAFRSLGFVVLIERLIERLVFILGLRRTWGQTDFFLGGVELNHTTHTQWVRDLAEVGAACADAGVLAVHLQAGVWPLDLLPLLLHALWLIRVHVRQALGILLAVVLAALGPRQQPTPHGLKPVLGGVLHVVHELPTAGALDGLVEQLLE